MLYDKLLDLNIPNERTDDVFGMEFKQRWEAREARRAADLAADMPDRPSLAGRALARGLALMSRGGSAAVRRLDGVVADDLGSSRSAAS